jgi:hypothetical protein
VYRVSSGAACGHCTTHVPFAPRRDDPHACTVLLTAGPQVSKHLAGMACTLLERLSSAAPGGLPAALQPEVPGLYLQVRGVGWVTWGDAI